MKKKGQRTFNNENVHRVKMHARLLDVFHQRGNVIDSLPASKSSAPSETKCLTSPSLSRPQKLSRTSWPETHRSRIIMRPRDKASLSRCFWFQSLSILCKTKKLSSVWRNNAGHWAVLKIELYKSSVVIVLYSVFGCDRSIAVFRFRVIFRAVFGFL